MAIKRQLDGLNYRQAQKRNSERFFLFSRKQQHNLRQQGYKNLGWDKVCQSWNLLQKYEYISLPIDLVDFARKKAEARYQKAKEGNNLEEILAAGKSIISSIKMKYQ
ncbi:MAG: hypothetical protein AAGE84_30290 [Cyanobacteria bacterium P01_G01_bin.39]